MVGRTEGGRARGRVIPSNGVGQVRRRRWQAGGVLSTLARGCARHRRLVALAWLGLLVLGFTVGGRVFGELSDSGGAADSESVRGAELVSAAGTTGVRVLALVDGAPVEGPAVRREVLSAADGLRRLDGVAAVADAYSSPAPQLRATDGRASLVVVDLVRDLPEGRVDALLAETRRALGAVEAAGADVRLGGDLLLRREINARVEADLRQGELISLPIALVVLVVVFGGVVAAGLPVLTAVAAVAGTLLALLGFAQVTDLSSEVVSVVTVMGLGIAIDYSLLLVSRYREERGLGLGSEAAIERTAATAGRTITFSALTVAVSLSGLLVFDEPVYRSIGLAGLGVVLVALGASLTLVPALLAMWSGRIGVPTEPVSDVGFFSRLTRRIQRRPLPVVLLTGAVLALGVVPFLGARFEDAGARLIPRSFETRQVYEALEARFPGREAEPVVVVAEVEPARLTAYGERLALLDGVRGVQLRTGLTGGVAALDVVPAGASQGAAARELVRELRAQDADFPTYVTGDAAFLVDFRAGLAERLPWALALIALATLVLLFLMTGSLLVPLKALVMNVLSLGASFGALVWIFQDGHLSGLLGFEPTGSIETWVPVIVFVFAFGLSMDYEVFLLARIKELSDAGWGNDDAVALGLQRSGRIITSAALIVTIVFAGFATGQMIGIKQMGLALAIAVFLDATLVRCLLVPATMSLLGSANWWAPGPLRRLHQRFGLSEAGAGPAAGAGPGAEPPAEAALTRP